MEKQPIDIYEIILVEKARRKLNNNALGELIGKSGDAFRMAIKRKSLTVLEIEKLRGFFDYEQNLSTNNLFVNEPLSYVQPKNGLNYEELPNGKYLVSVPLVPVKAEASYIGNYDDADFVSDLTHVTFIVDKVGLGKYQAFEIKNDSMNDGTIENAIPSGSYVLAREVQRHLWKDKLKYNQFPYWIIVHKDSIICKQIINHDLEKAKITCHSINESPEYQDFDLELNDVVQLFNIVKRQI